MTTQPQRRIPKTNGKRKGEGLDRVVWGLAAAFLVMVCLGGIVVHVTVRQAVASGNPFGPAGFEPNVTPGTAAAPGAAPTPTLVPLDTEPMPWTGNSRVTVLLMGLDYRDWEAGAGAPRTDSMMLVSFDPLTRHAVMLSIPRDLWIEIPGYSHNRINTAFTFGEAYRLPGGGPGLAVEAVESVVGVPINYYAVIEFSAFERLIDEIGGIDVLVTERIKISPIGRMSFYLSAKAHHLDGAEALAYARVRKATGGDFGRAQRQQQVALAVLDQVLDLNMVPTLVARAPRLYQELSDGIRTNMTLPQMVSLGWLAIQLPRENIHQGVIGPPDMVRFHTTASGAQVLRPVPDRIAQLVEELFVQHSAVGAAPSEIQPATNE
ncbi:MAG TPA: LCP family protein [Anaerolineales bacterium]|jgi:LCP family protein required for cell wall assembly